MPGVLLIECAAQTAGALWASMLAADAPKHFILAQVLQFKLQQPVLPGETLETHVTLENTLGSVAQFGVTLNVNHVEVARGRIVLSQPNFLNQRKGLRRLPSASSPLTLIAATNGGPKDETPNPADAQRHVNRTLS